MKKILMVLILASGAFYASAQIDDQQNNDEIRTIFSKHHRNGWYGAFSSGYGKVDSKDALISGGRLMFIFDRVLGIGFGGSGFFNDLNNYHFSSGRPAVNTLAGGYGGLIIEPIAGGKLPVHLSFPILAGIGGVAVNESGWWSDGNYFEGVSDTYLVFEPSAELEFNLTKFLRASAYTSYRFTSKINLEQAGPNSLEGLNVGFTIKLGKF
jgi:hypothetical protein